MATTYGIEGLTVVAVDRFGKRIDLNAGGEPCETPDGLRYFIHGLYRDGCFEPDSDGLPDQVARRAAAIRDELLAEAVR